MDLILYWNGTLDRQGLCPHSSGYMGPSQLTVQCRRSQVEIDRDKARWHAKDEAKRVKREAMRAARALQRETKAEMRRHLHTRHLAKQA